MTITNDLSNFGLMANAMYNSMTANATAITSMSVGTANSANLTTTTNVATIGTSAYFVANGNVGIGTASPTGKLHVVGGSKTDGVGTFLNGGSSEGGEINFLNPDNTTVGLYVDVAGTNNPRMFSIANNMAMQIGQLGSGTTNGSISLHTSSAQRAIITANGNVGINQTSPTARLDVSGGIRASGGATYGTGVCGYSFNSGDTDGGMFSPSDGTLVFATNNVERMRIDSSGRVGIGVNPENFLHVNGDIQINSFQPSSTFYSSFALIAYPGGSQNYLRYYHQPGVEAGAQFSLNGGQSTVTFRNDGTCFAANWYSYSDTRVKSDQLDIEDSLNKIKQLNGITYRLNNSTKLNGSPIVDAGLIAQDVEKVLPQCVERLTKPPESDPDGEGLLSLNYNGVTALLVNAVKELNAKTDAALAVKDAEIEALKTRLDALEKKLN